MKKNISILLCLLLLIINSGCATIVSGKSQDVKIHSDPTGADVYINHIKMGATPMIADLERKERHTIRFHKNGYEEETRMTRKGFNWWFVGNVIFGFGGIIGIIIDFATGALYTVQPKEVSVFLTQAKGQAKVVSDTGSTESTT